MSTSEVKENTLPSKDSSTTTEQARSSTEADKPVAGQADVEKQQHTASKRLPGSTVRRILTFVGLQFALFLAALDATIVSTALPTIGSDFNAFAISSWVVTAYILTFDIFQPLYTKFSDIFGRKIMMLIGISIFLFGSLLCAVSTSMIMLIVCRAVAGIGGAGIVSMVFVIISDIVPLEKRGQYQGVVTSVFTLASLCGPLIGGSFIEYVTWRWNFYINLPIGGVAMAIIVFALHLPTPKEKFVEKIKRVDFVGTILAIVFSTLFLLAMNFGGQMYPWKSAAVIVPLVFTVVLIGVFAVVEKKFAREPLMPPRLFKIRSVVSILTMNFLFGISMFSMLFYLPVYFQVVRNDSPMWSGIRMFPLMIFLTAVSTATGFLISRYKIYRIFMWCGTALLTVGVGLLTLCDIDTPWAQIYVFTSIGGVGLGMLQAAAVIGLQASVERKDIAVAIGLGNFTRVIGGAVGVAISSAILNSSLNQDLPGLMPEQYAAAVISSSDYIRNGLPAEYIPATLQSYVDALRLNWYVKIGLSAAAFIASFFVQHHDFTPRNQIPKKEPTDADNTKGSAKINPTNENPGPATVNEDTEDPELMTVETIADSTEEIEASHHVDKQHDNNSSKE